MFLSEKGKTEEEKKEEENTERRVKKSEKQTCFLRERALDNGLII